MAIQKLSKVTTLDASDLLPVFSQALGGDAAATLASLQAWLQSQITAASTPITQYAAPQATGFNILIAPPVAGTSVYLLITPTAGFAAGTITFPPIASCVDGQQIVLICTQAVTAVTFDGNGAPIIGAPTTLFSNGYAQFRYDGVFDQWFRIGTSNVLLTAMSPAQIAANATGSLAAGPGASQTTQTEILGWDGLAPAVLRGTVSGHRWPGVTQVATGDQPTQIATLAGLQAAVNYASTNRKFFELEPGVYEIYGANGLKLPASYPGFQWKGVRRSTILSQFYVNAPVLQCCQLLTGESDSGTNIDGVAVQYGVDQTGQTNAIGIRIGATWKSTFRNMASNGVNNGVALPTLRPYHACQIKNISSSGAAYFSNIMEECSFGQAQVSNLAVALNGTGNVFRNIYTVGGGAPNAQPMTGPCVDISMGGPAYTENVFEQLNVEWAIAPAFINCNNVRGITFLSTHFEGCQLAGVSPYFVQANLSYMQIIGMHFLNCHILAAQLTSGKPVILQTFRTASINVLGLSMLWDNQAGIPQVDQNYFLANVDATSPSRGGVIQGGAFEIVDNDPSAAGQLNVRPSTYQQETGWAGLKIFKLDHMQAAEPMPTFKGGIIDISQTQTVYAVYENVQWRLTTTPGVASTLTLAIKCFPTQSGSRGQLVPPRVGQMCYVSRGVGTADGFTWTINNSVGTSIGTLTASDTGKAFFYNGTDWVAA